MQQNNSKGEFNFVSVLLFVNRHKVKLIGIFVLSGLLGFVFSSPWIVTPLYKSTAICYAAGNQATSSALTSNNGKAELGSFGEEEEAEQLLQLLQSQVITDALIKRVDLMKHYGIDSSTSYPYTKFMEKYKKRVRFRRTEYMSVEISVLDSDPYKAAEIANIILDEVDSVKFKAQRDRFDPIFKIVEQEYKDKEAYVNTLADSLQKIGDLGVPLFQNSSSSGDADYYKLLAEGKTKLAAEVKANTALKAKYNPIQKTLLDRIEFETEQLSELSAKYKEAKVNAQQAVPAKFVIDRAAPAERKFFPKRSIVSLIAGFAGLIALLVVMAIRDTLAAQKLSAQESEAKS